jgi:PEP-CTERM motif-containing protein
VHKKEEKTMTITTVVPTPRLTQLRRPKAASIFCAALVAMALIPLGAASAEAASITCAYGTTGFCSTDGLSGGFANGNTARFGFDTNPLQLGYDYFLDLTFDQLTTGNPFNVTVSDTLTTQLAMAAKLGSFPGFTCVPIYDGISTCVEFSISAPAPNVGDSWVSQNSPFLGFQIDITWAANTDTRFPGGSGNVRMIHDTGAPDTYDTDMTIAGSYFDNQPTCQTLDCGGGVTELDPGVSGLDNNFSTVSVIGIEAVPEPITGLLVMSGLGVLAYRRRRQAR